MLNSEDMAEPDSAIELEEKKCGFTKDHAFVTWNPIAKVWQTVNGKTYPEDSVVQLVGKPIHHKLTVQDLAKYRDGPFMPTPKEGSAYGTDEQLYDELKAFVKTYSELPSEIHYSILCCFALASWRVHQAQTATYLNLLAPHGSGKSTVLEMLLWLCNKTVDSEGATRGAIIRACDGSNATLLLDEADQWLDARDFDNPLAAVLNAGYRRKVAGGVMICEPSGDKKGYQVVVLDSFGFKAIGGRNPLNDVLGSRCLTIRMRKSFRQFPKMDLEAAWKLRRKLVRYAETHMENLEDAAAQRIQEPRLREIMEPLLTVAPNDQVKAELVEFANEEKKRRDLAEQTSDEAQITCAVIQILKEDSSRGTIRLKEITERLNLDVSNPQEQFSTRTVGIILRRLGFETEHTKLGAAVTIKLDLIQYLTERYAPEESKHQGPLDKIINGDAGDGSDAA